MSRDTASTIDIGAAAARMRHRRATRRACLAGRLELAQRDAARMIDHIARAYRPSRIHQWGSLVHTDRFSEISDIDIAVEGLEGGEEAVAGIRNAAETMTDFHVDIVILERVDRGRADLIRRFGRVAWERGGDG